jgi:SAM-dependent methyltransferase
VLTVDYERLGLEPGDRLLDIGAGAGRHAFEALRRGATTLACDLDPAGLAACQATARAMTEAGEVPNGARAAVVRGSALHLPFATGAFDRVVAAEVLEHIDDDRGALDELARVLRPGGTLAVTVPAWLPETICWRLDEAYHAPTVPDGHLRIYSGTVLRARLRRAGFAPTGAHRAHGLHSPYWWLRCAVGVRREDHPAVVAYHRLLVWDIERRPIVTRLAERLLAPVLGKSLVVYATRRWPATTEGLAARDGARSGERADVAA